MKIQTLSGDQLAEVVEELPFAVIETPPPLTPAWADSERKRNLGSTGVSYVAERPLDNHGASVPRRHGVASGGWSDEQLAAAF